MTLSSDIPHRDRSMSEISLSEQQPSSPAIGLLESDLTSGDCYEFSTFRLFPKQRMLLRGTERVGIGGRALDLLLLLVSQAGTVVGVPDLIQTVWPNVTVDHTNLRVQIGILRKILSQCDGAKRAIDTIPLRGYCFVLPVRLHPNRIGPSDPEPESGCPLPLLPSSTVGREDAIQAIYAALNERRLVSITGPGGIGKTTVAIATAKRYAATFAPAMHFVDLSDVTDGAGVAQLIAEALHLPPSRMPLERLCEHYRYRRSLLILDTCEHIVEQVAPLAEALLSQCPDLRLLVTSQEALRATGEWTYRLRSLTFPAEGTAIEAEHIDAYSAISLFVDRVQSSTRFEPDGQELSIIADICRRLDGIPLALEFAAGRVEDLGLRNIAAHLNDCFAILTRGRRTALPRHRTLIAAFDWSYDLLSDDEKSMLSYLAALGGSFTAAQVVARCLDRTCERPSDAFYSLYDKSLLTLDITSDEPSFRLLDTTRTYVLDSIGRREVVQDQYSFRRRVCS
jgi:predicted ATPase/DNA-binding winged helix-turn-helix (wHTH) protein